MKYPSIRELETTPPDQIDEIVEKCLLEPIDLTTEGGKLQGSSRAAWVTSLREAKLWPPHEREGQ